MAQFQSSLILLLALIAGALCYPSGAPPEACASLNPTSHGKSTATGSPPYTLMIGANSYKPMQKIEVTLAGVGSAMFKGFLVEGRVQNTKATDPVGYFTNSTTAKVACDTGKTGNGITHIDATPKTKEAFVWTAPSSDVGDVIFHYTVVRGGAPNTTADPADYFMDIKSMTLPSSKTQDFTGVNIV